MDAMHDRLEGLARAVSERSHMGDADDGAQIMKSARRGRTIWRAGVGTVAAVSVLGLVSGGVALADAIGAALADNVNDPAHEQDLDLDQNTDGIVLADYLRDEEADGGYWEYHEERWGDEHANDEGAADEGDSETAGGTTTHEGAGSSGAEEEGEDPDPEAEYEWGYGEGDYDGFWAAYELGYDGLPPDDPIVVPTVEGTVWFEDGYEDGYLNGYDRGYEEGVLDRAADEAEAYDHGFAEGAEDGRNDGWWDGYYSLPYDDSPPVVEGLAQFVAGYYDAYPIGYDEGYDNGVYEREAYWIGYAEGYDAGHADGLAGEPFDDTPPVVEGNGLYIEGHRDGWRAGYEPGYHQGEEDAG